MQFMLKQLKISSLTVNICRPQEVNFFSPQWSGGQNSVMSMSSDICNFCTCVTGCPKFSYTRAASRDPRFKTTWSRNDGRWALGTRMVVKCRPSPPLNLLGRGGRESGESLSAPHHHRVSGVETVVTLYERANIDIYALLLNSKKRTLFECQCV